MKTKSYQTTMNEQCLVNRSKFTIRKLQVVTLISGIILSAMLSACSSNGSNHVVVTGVVADEPIVGAQVKVFLAPSEDEALTETVLGTGVTDSNGRYTLVVNSSPPYRITTTGGTMNGQPFPGVLTAYCETADQCNASPYTSALDLLMVEEGKSEAESAYLLTRLTGIDYDPFLHEISTGQAAQDILFNLSAAKATLTTKEAIDSWIAGLAFAAQIPGASAPAGVVSPVQPADEVDPLLKGPYLMLTGANTEMKILWQTQKDISINNVVLLWRASTSPAWNTVSPSPTSTQDLDYLYQHTLTDLTPGTRYDYTVKITYGATNLIRNYNGSFRTPPDQDAKDVTFYAYGDTRSNPHTHNSVVSGISSDIIGAADHRQTFVFHVGDFVLYGHNESYWNSQFFVRGSDFEGTQTFLSTFPVTAAVGNHEFRDKGDNACGKTNNADIFRKYWPSSLYHLDAGNMNYYYSFDYGPVHFVVMDTYTASYKKGSTQYEWIEKELRETNKLWKVVGIHVPFYNASGSNAGAGCSIENVGKELHKEIKPLLEKYGVQLVLQGHQHYYSRSTIKKITYLVVGGGGAPLESPKLIRLPLDSVPRGKYGHIHQFARIEASASEMKVSIIEVVNADHKSSNAQPSNSLFEEITIKPDGKATVKPGTSIK